MHNAATCYWLNKQVAPPQTHTIGCGNIAGSCSFARASVYFFRIINWDESWYFNIGKNDIYHLTVFSV